MNTDTDMFSDIRRDIPQKGFKGTPEALKAIYPGPERTPHAPIDPNGADAAGGEGFESKALLESTPLNVNMGMQWRNKKRKAN